MKIAPAIEDETQVTELTIMPDGRVFVFGTSRQILEILHELDPHDEKLNRVLARARDIEQAPLTPEITVNGQ